MAKLTILFILIVPAFFVGARLAAAQDVDAQTDMITVTCVLRARSADRVKEDLVALAAANDGYLLKMSDRHVEVYLSRKLTANGVINKLAEYGQLVERSVGGQDVAEKIRDLGTAIRVREEHLARLQKMVEGSNIEQALELEKEVNGVISAIEENRGELNYLRERVGLMHVTVRFVETTSGTTDPGLPIDWIRALTIEDFLERF